MSEELYWPVDSVTLEVSQSAVKAHYLGGLYHVPKNALRTQPLPIKNGFIVVAILNESGQAIDSKYVEDHRGSVIYDKSDCKNVKYVEDVGPIPEGWTLEKPQTQWDKWFEEHWKTDEQAKFEHDYQLVNDKRYALYTVMVDRLRNEAASIESVEGDSIKAAEYRAQADAAYLKIKEDNPFPEPPELTP